MYKGSRVKLRTTALYMEYCIPIGAVLVADVIVGGMADVRLENDNAYWLVKLDELISA